MRFAHIEAPNFLFYGQFFRILRKIDKKMIEIFTHFMYNVPNAVLTAPLIWK